VQQTKDSALLDPRRESHMLCLIEAHDDPRFGGEEVPDSERGGCKKIVF